MSEKTAGLAAWQGVETGAVSKASVDGLAAVDGSSVVQPHLDLGVPARRGALEVGPRAEVEQVLARAVRDALHVSIEERTPSCIP